MMTMTKTMMTLMRTLWAPVCDWQRPQEAQCSPRPVRHLGYFLSRFQWYGAGDYGDEDGDDDDDGDDVDGDADDHDDGGVDKISPLVAAQ